MSTPEKLTGILQRGGQAAAALVILRAEMLTMETVAVREREQALVERNDPRIHYWQTRLEVLRDIRGTLELRCRQGTAAEEKLHSTPALTIGRGRADRDT